MFDGLWVEERYVLQMLRAEGVNISHEDVEHALTWQATFHAHAIMQ
jgi:hypothetical protein